MIIENLSSRAFGFLKDIEGLGFSLCLIGGIPRDYFYDGKIGHDFDFEIRPSVKLDNPLEEWPLYYKKLHHYLSINNIEFTELPYLITRVWFDNIDFEFSSPRSEINLPANFTHHHFTATLDPHLPYEASFKRRDFTLNAIGIELNLGLKQESIIDPYGGREDLKKGILKNISNDFFLDSVRFLRLIRFKVKFEEFKIEENLLGSIRLFNLTHMSIHYFKEELFKSNAGPFLNLFSELVLAGGLSIPKKFKIWTKYTFPVSIQSKEEILAYVFINNEEDAKEIISFFSMPEKKLKDLKSFMASYEFVAKMEELDFKKILDLPMEEALKNKLFKELKNLGDKKEWQNVCGMRPDLRVPWINWREWSEARVETSELNSISPTLRSNYLYYKILKEKFR